jgi:hypothetical protein
VDDARAETGGQNRTPRSEIRPAVSGNRKKEPVLLLDLSTSMNWGAADEYGPEWPDAGSRRSIVIEALYGLVRVLEREDSEAAAEQAGGSDELGGLMTHGFANRHIEIGDLNSSNIERRLNEIKWGGKTYIMPAWKAALADYDEEFGDRDPDEQPVMLTLVITDGEADDWKEFEPVLERATAKRVFVVAVVGHGRKHDATLAAYQEAARSCPPACCSAGTGRAGRRWGRGRRRRCGTRGRGAGRPGGCCRRRARRCRCRGTGGRRAPTGGAPRRPGTGGRARIRRGTMVTRRPAGSRGGMRLVAQCVDDLHDRAADQRRDFELPAAAVREADRQVSA